MNQLIGAKLHTAPWSSQLLAIAMLGLTFVAAQAASNNTWKTTDLSKALDVQSRPQADRDRDADRKPADTLTFMGVEKGMAVVDVVAAGGYFTEVLSIAVGPRGKVYMQNPPAMLKFRDDAYDKAATERVAGDRLPNVVRVDSDFPAVAIAPGSVDFAITALNLHDVYNRDAAAGEAFLKSVYDVLKPGGVFGVIDHVGNEGANNATLHRMPKQSAVDAAKKAGFTVDAESPLLAHPGDDHTKGVFDPTLRGKTDQFVLKLRKPK